MCEATRWMLGASIHRAERSAFWRDARPTSRFSGAGLLAAKRRRGRCRAECGQALAAVHTPGGAGVGRLRFPPSGSGVDQLRQGFPRSGAGCFGTCAQRPIVESVYCQALADKIGVMISTLSAFCVPTAFPTSEICQA